MFSEPLVSHGERRRGINSVEIGISVLQAVVEIGGPASLKEIAARSELESSQAHRYVSALVNCGMLKQTDSGQYDLGYTSVRTGLAGLARLPMLTAAKETAEHFTATTGATTLLAVWSVHGPTIIGWNQGRPPVYTILTIGSTLPVTLSSTGRVFMAYAPESVLEPFLKDEGWKSPLSKNPELVKLRDEIRRTRVSSVHGTVVPGLRAHATPVLGPSGTIVAVIAAVAADPTPRDRDAEIETQLVRTCFELSRQLGDTGPSTAR